MEATRTWRDIAGRDARIALPPEPTGKRTRLGRKVTWPGPGETWATYTPHDAEVRPLYRIPADDNRPTRGVVIPLVEHREVRQEPPAQPPSPMRVRLNLQETAPAAYRTLVRVEELLRPAELTEVEGRPSADNDNTDFGVDYRHDISPGNATFADDLLAAYADGMRTRVVIDKQGRVDRYKGGITFHCDSDDAGQLNGLNEIVEIGGRSSRGKFFGMRFYRGELVAYAKNGKREAPMYDIGDQRGPDGDAWLPRETTDSAPQHRVLAEIDRAASAADLMYRAGGPLMERLRLVLDADSFAEIGLASGYAQSAAHRHGKRIAIDTLKKIEKLAA